MIFTDISPDSLVHYGQFVLPLALLIGALGVPLPNTLLLLTAGAFIQTGTLGVVPIVPLALVTVVLGDAIGYLVGRYGGSLVIGRLSRGRWADDTWHKSRETFRRWGGGAVFVTRFLLTPLAVPTNLAAGMSRYPFRRFLAFDAAGEVVWVGLFIGLGYLFTGSLKVLSTAASDLAWILLVATVVGFGIYRFYRRRSGRTPM